MTQRWAGELTRACALTRCQKCRARPTLPALGPVTVIIADAGHAGDQEEEI